MERASARLYRGDGKGRSRLNRAQALRRCFMSRSEGNSIGRLLLLSGAVAGAAVPALSPSRLKTEVDVLSRRGHRSQKFGVGFGFGQTAEQELHRFDRRKRAQYLAQNPDAAEFIGRKEQFVLARAGALDVDGRKDALVGKAAVQVDFHVAGTLELFKNDVVHAAAGVNQRGGDDGERAAFLDVPGCRKKAPRALQGVGVDTAGKNFARGRRDGVVGARKT